MSPDQKGSGRAGMIKKKRISYISETILGSYNRRRNLEFGCLKRGQILEAHGKAVEL